ncbi:MAG: 2-oxo acid dehydrogenase subunit E2 [Bacteroidales bacterium]|nr:2-oxo acid dehydrogenase subunit E2 [Bacteroidales bacterium]
MSRYKTTRFPASRIASIDVCDIGKQKHHVTALIELDVTESRKRIKQHKTEKNRISFTAWLIKVISLTIKEHEMTAAFLKGKRQAFVFEDVNVSLLVEKESNGQKVPMPVIIEKAHEADAVSITRRIADARQLKLSEKDIVLQKKSGKWERLYYHLPGFLRRQVWKFMLKHPRLVFSKMGNVAITSIGMMGNIKGWFIPISVHPICFGISTITKKPLVINDQITIREVLSMTILMDHDVIDGALMARFISDLTKNIENGKEL